MVSNYAEIVALFQQIIQIVIFLIELIAAVYLISLAFIEGAHAIMPLVVLIFFSMVAVIAMLMLWVIMIRYESIAPRH